MNGQVVGLGSQDSGINHAYEALHVQPVRTGLSL